MDFRKKFFVPPGGKIKLAKIDPAYKGKHSSHQTATPEIARRIESLAEVSVHCSHACFAAARAICSHRPFCKVRRNRWRTQDGLASATATPFGARITRDGVKAI
jgi:hypothetical protein